METNSIRIEEFHHLTTNRTFNYLIEQNESKNLLKNIVKATVFFTAFNFSNVVNTYSNIQEPVSAIYSNQNVKINDKLINRSTNVVESYLIDEEGMGLVPKEDDVRQRDLDNIKETIEAKLGTVTVKINNVSDDISDVKTSIKDNFLEIKGIINDINIKIDNLPTEEYVNNKVNGLLVKVGSGAVILFGLLIAYLEWRFV
ncbi:hypothetical protein [Carnobacterium sp. ISL-102]|uniref:hypothetical protein n=1 Tax=Carnobacterium sp. ISL-102 TaxID=2819142 RepID=UPI001BED323F|nr:hypothetical protein [Carnobacterium sp. ISL-102]MBT2732132.1 hypothetical protein [Carnobacterium sp. ISL-102]